MNLLFYKKIHLAKFSIFGYNMSMARENLYKELEQKRNSKLLVYITGDKPGWETL